MGHCIATALLMLRNLRVDWDPDDLDFVPSVAIHLLGKWIHLSLSQLLTCKKGIVIMQEVLGGLQNPPYGLGLLIFVIVISGAIWIPSVL